VREGVALGDAAGVGDAVGVGDAICGGDAVGAAVVLGGAVIERTGVDVADAGGGAQVSASDAQTARRSKAVSARRALCSPTRERDVP